MPANTNNLENVIFNTSLHFSDMGDNMDEYFALQIKSINEDWIDNLNSNQSFLYYNTEELKDTSIRKLNIDITSFIKSFNNDPFNIRLIVSNFKDVDFVEIGSYLVTYNYISSQQEPEPEPEPMPMPEPEPEPMPMQNQSQSQSQANARTRARANANARTRTRARARTTRTRARTIIRARTKRAKPEPEQLPSNYQYFKWFNSRWQQPKECSSSRNGGYETSFTAWCSPTTAANQWIF